MAARSALVVEPVVVEPVVLVLVLVQPVVLVLVLDAAAGTCDAAGDASAASTGLLLLALPRLMLIPMLVPLPLASRYPRQTSSSHPQVRALSRAIRASLILPYGRFGLLVPRKLPLLYAVGRPIECPGAGGPRPSFGGSKAFSERRKMCLRGFARKLGSRIIVTWHIP